MAGELLFKLGVAQYLGVGLQRVGYLLLLGRGEHGARCGHGDQLAKLADLRDRGVIAAGEFDREKATILT